MAHRGSKALDTLEKKVIGTIALSAFCASALIVILEVAARYLFSHSFMWAHETVIYLAAGAAFLYFGIAHRESGHLAIHVLPRIIRNRRLQRFFGFLAAAVGMIYCLFCAFLTLKLVRLFHSNHVKSINAELPVWIFYTCLFVGFVLLALNIFRRQFPPSEKTTESPSP